MKRCACVKPVSKNILHPISAVAYDSERKRQRHGMHPFHIRHRRHVNAGKVSGTLRGNQRI
jgi:hypothetical protein